MASHNKDEPETYDFIVVANRLPVDSVTDEAGNQHWRMSPGGLVAALEPLMKSTDGAWVGWPGAADVVLDPFEQRYGIDRLRWAS